MQNKQPNQTSPAKISFDEFISTGRSSYSVGLLIFAFIVLFSVYIVLRYAPGTRESIFCSVFLIVWGGGAIGIIIHFVRGRRYLRKLNESTEALRKDTVLFNRLQQEYEQTDLTFGMVGLGEQHLFLLGHIPVEYGMIESAEYRPVEQSHDTSGTTPESLALRVHLINGQNVDVEKMPCPPERTATKDGRHGQRQVRVSLQERVNTEPEYTALLKEINSRAGQKSTDENGTAFEVH